MKPANPQIRPPFKCHGGKYYLAPKLINLFPDHDIYVEPFVGGGNVLLNKPKSRIEIACDLNYNIIATWKIIKNYSDRLQDYLLRVECNEDEFDRAVEIVESCNYCDWYDEKEVITFGASFIIRNHFSRGGYGEKWAHSKRYRRGSYELVKSWKNFVNNALPRITERIQDVEFYYDDFHAILGEDKSFSDDPFTLIYCDPPYLHETRTIKDANSKYEMSNQDHEDLLEILLNCISRVFISGYWSNLYGDKLRSWKFRAWDVPNRANQKQMKQRRVECLWENQW